ncbi:MULTISPECIES: hypothetical protein [unclassified Pseudoxanthomonas]|uniref:hypothetical protein n=1 Tax=unclassified Pseudoxanthomonas TaxID=2645906 RepID=UPI0016210DEA|nr:MULTISPECIES: hypothetical protein [unclassified Pseudoxanthomonas]MBB3278082.1 hypothetical protein [Pseudoxanthomonas sp. OG2]MBV7475937.1 hypothetical protein [Pseudoxanthomonas sp. PXM05]
MIYPKLMTVAFKLASSTNAGHTKWQETEVDGMYQTSFARSSIRIATRRSKIDELSNEYFIEVLNADGDVVAELGDEDPSDIDERGRLYTALKETFEVAQRHASGADDILDDIIEEIDREGLPF